MKIYINNKNEIKDVHNTTNKNLVEITINDEGNPFANWSTEKICCHKVTVVDGVVTNYTPYVDSRIIEHIEKLGKSDESATINILDTQIGLTEAFEKALSTEATITDVQLAIVELYEMMTGGGNK